MNKLFAITATGKSIRSFLDLRFGHAEYIVFYMPGGGEPEIVDNPYREEENAGLKLAQLIEKKKADIIITGEVGPKVGEFLERKKIQLVLPEEERIRVEDLIARIG